MERAGVVSRRGATLACPVRLNDQGGYYETIIGVNTLDGTQFSLTLERWNYVGQAVWLDNGRGLLLSASREAGSPMQVWHVSLPDGSATRITNDLNNYYDLSLTADSSRVTAVQVHRISSIWVAPNADASRAK